MKHKLAIFRVIFMLTHQKEKALVYKNIKRTAALYNGFVNCVSGAKFE